MIRFGGIWKASATSPKASPEALARIKAMTRELLALDDDATVSANEIICADPSCPGAETVVLVMRPGLRTKAYKLRMSAEEATREALAEAFGDDVRPAGSPPAS